MAVRQPAPYPPRRRRGEPARTETLGRMLRRLRTRLEMPDPSRPSGLVPLSQNQLAYRAGIDSAYVNRLERERPSKGMVELTRPRRAIILALGTALELDDDDLDRLLFAAGLAPETDYQARAELLQAKLDIIISAVGRAGNL